MYTRSHTHTHTHTHTNTRRQTSLLVTPFPTLHTGNEGGLALTDERFSLIQRYSPTYQEPSTNSPWLFAQLFKCSIHSHCSPRAPPVEGARVMLFRSPVRASGRAQSWKDAPEARRRHDGFGGSAASKGSVYFDGVVFRGRSYADCLVVCPPACRQAAPSKRDKSWVLCVRTGWGGE